MSIGMVANEEANQFVNVYFFLFWFPPGGWVRNFHRIFIFIEFPQVLSTFYLNISSPKIIKFCKNVEDVLMIIDNTPPIDTNQRYEEYLISFCFSPRLLFISLLFISLNGFLFTNERLS